MDTTSSIESKAAAERYSSDSSTYNRPSIDRCHHDELQPPFQILNRTRRISIVFSILVAIAIIVLLEWACRSLPALPAQQFLSDMSKRDIPTEVVPPRTIFLDYRDLMTTNEHSEPVASYSEEASTTSTEPAPPTSSSTFTGWPTVSYTQSSNSFAIVGNVPSTTTTSTSTSTSTTHTCTISQCMITSTPPSGHYPTVNSDNPSIHVHPSPTVKPPKGDPPVLTRSHKPATITLTPINNPPPSVHGGYSSIGASDHKPTPDEKHSKSLSPTDTPQSSQSGSSKSGSNKSGSSQSGSSKSDSSKSYSSKSDSSKSGSSKKESSDNIDTPNSPHSDHLKSSDSGDSVPGDIGAEHKLGHTEPPATTAAADSLPQSQSTGKASESVITYKFTTMTIATGSPTSTPFAMPTPEVPLTILSYETYLVGAWVPTFVALLFAVPWLMLDTFFRTIEPYRQLASDQGATAADSLCLNYVNSWLFITPFRALSKRHWPVFLSSTLSCVAILLMALAPEAVYIHVTGPCTLDNPGGCHPSLVIFRPVARTIQALMVIMVVLALALVLTAYAQSIPVSFDPRSIGATTILSNNDVVLSTVRALDPGMSRTEIVQRLGDFRYKLGPYENGLGGSCIGIYGFSPQNSRSLLPNKDFEPRSSADHLEPDQTEESSRKRQHLLYRIAIVATALVVTALFIMITYYYKLDYENGYERFMDSQTLGVRLLFVSMGVLLKLAWRYFHQDYIRMLPYHRLAAGYAPLESTILRTPPHSTIGAMFASIKYKQPFAAFLALVTLLANILPLSLPNIPFSRVTPMMALKISTFCSVGVFSLMLIASVLLFFSPRSRLLPRDPGTIATVLLFVCNSQMLDLFSDLQHTNQKMRDATMKRAEYSYGLGMLTCDDGQKRLGIDRDPFVEYTT